MKPAVEGPWRKSSFSGNDNAQCLEVRDGVPGVVPVRDGKVPGAGGLTVRADAWRAFVGMVRRPA
ncbi:DUF397 domain-containing protein [Streptomyces aidingensis]|uniref:DUF397 domain-containing protein n=1 Tax=Streptomyces aidingensis TaxID=910347 RepID=A0A1I1GV96_9ACTN|nr:DUF397 domain-containing protein [Streptomyces aidingensis]SFC13103.1 protein of unknown function [Streptomyces aidingensis]